MAEAAGLSGAPADTTAASVVDGHQTVVITARTGTYGPANVEVRSGVPTTHVVKSDGAQGFVRSFIIPDRAVEEILPIEGETRVELGVLRPGRLDYSRGMGMYTGVLTIT